MNLVKMKLFQHKTDLFFDLDHTLWDFEKNSALAFETIFEKHQFDIRLSNFLLHYVPTNIKYWKLYREEKITQNELRYFRLKEVFDLMQQEVDNSLIHLLSKEYIEYLPQFNHLYEGTFEILDYLKENYNLHIITNGFESVQLGKIRNSNLESYFTTITHSDLAGVKKPNPKIFEFALNYAQTSPGNSVMIGDSLEADIYGALSIGMDAIYFNEFQVPTESSIHQVNQLANLKQFF